MSDSNQMLIFACQKSNLTVKKISMTVDVIVCNPTKRSASCSNHRKEKQSLFFLTFFTH
jgi:hypothetical protein